MTGTAYIGIAAVFGLCGALAGAAHLMLLSWNVRALVGRSHALLTAAASMGRAVVALTVFVFAASHGALALLALLAGFLLCRAVAMRRPELLLP